MAPTKSLTILVTGANRGIGFAIIQALAFHPATRDSTLLLGCRDRAKGDAAVTELRTAGITSPLHVLPIDITSDSSVRTAVSTVEQQHGGLDVLINNAGYATVTPASDFSDYRQAYADIFNTNVISVALTMQLFLPLLRKSSHVGKIINISSARGSITRSVTGLLPPTVSIPYCVSKTALNALTVEMSRAKDNEDVEFQLASPGHCKTAFNDYRGTRDPLEGANVVVELVASPKKPGKVRGSGRLLATARN